MSTVRITTDGEVSGHSEITFEVTSVRYDPGLEQVEIAGENGAIRKPCSEAEARAWAGRVGLALEVVASCAFVPPDDDEDLPR